MTLTRAAPGELLSSLADSIECLWLLGGGELAASFQKQGLITTYMVSVIPIVLGAGIPLLGSGATLERLALLDSTRFDNGVVQLQYAARQRDPRA